MDSLISIHNIWCNKIFNKEKFLEFRNNIGKDIHAGDKVYMYETYFNKGRKKVVGEFTIKSINPIFKNHSRLGCYSFLKIYAEKVVKDEELLKKVEKALSINLTGYYNDLVLNSLFVPEELEYMEKYSLPMPTDFETSFKKYSDKSYLEAKNKADKLMKDCDDWLRNIGYYNDLDESNYKYMIEIENPIRYDNPIAISEFELLNGNKIKRAPQSWCYVKKN